MSHDSGSVGRLGSAQGPEPTAHDLVRQAQEGDSAAFGVLADRLWADLVSFTRVALGADAEAEDVVQDALITAWTQIRALHHPEAFGAWLRRIVWRRALRVVGRRRWLLGLTTRSPSAPFDTTVEVHDLLQTLTVKQRTVFYLTEIEDWSDTEIAQALGMRPTTVRTHRRRARANLKRQLGVRKP